METIDLHTHILPERWPDLAARYGYGDWLRMESIGGCRARLYQGERFFREIEDNCWSPARRLEDCAAVGVDVQVLSTVPVMFSYWARPADAYDLARLLNDHIAGVVAEHPTRFEGLATLPMQHADLAIRELERAVAPASRGGLGLRGVQIGTHVNGMNLYHDALQPIFDAAAELGAAVFVHPWDMLARERMSRYWMPWLVGMPAETCLAACDLMFGGVLERLPKLRVCFAHGGGSLAGTIGRIEHGYHARPDLCAGDSKRSPREYLARSSDGAGEPTPARFWVDSLVHDATVLRALLALFTPRRIALGTDYPFPLGEARPGELIDSLGELSAEERKWLRGGAAREFLGG